MSGAAVDRASPRQWLLQEYDAPRPQPSHDVVARFSNVSLDIPAASARKACDLVAEGEDDGSSPHKGAPRTPQTAAREAASEAAREAARGTTRDPADATKRSIRSAQGLSLPPRPLLHAEGDGGVPGGENLNHITVLREDGTMVGLYTVVAEAVEAASAGCIVCLPGGVFEASLIIRQPIRLISREYMGSPQKVGGDAVGLMVGSSLVSRGETPAVTVKCKGVSMAGILVQQTDGLDTRPVRAGSGRLRSPRSPGDDGREREDGSECGAICVEAGGNLTMDHCIVRNDRGVCLIVSGEKSMVTAKMSRFVEGAKGGILFEGGAGGLVSECDVALNRQFGILATHGSAPEVIHCLVHDGGAEGLVFYEAGGLVSDCDIYSNAGMGVCITEHADPRIERCRLFKGRSCGILVQDGGRGVIHDNDVSGHEMSEIEVRSDGRPLVTENRLHDSKGSGILVDAARGEYHRNNICGNARAGIRLKGGASAVLAQNRITGGAQSGVLVESKSTGTLEKNTIELNGHCGVQLRDDADATLRHNAICRNAHMGLLIFNGADGLIQGNDIKGNGMSGIGVMLNAAPRIIGNHLHANLQCGLIFNQGGKGLLQGNHIHANVQEGVRIETQANPVAVGNSIFNGQHHGVLVCDGGLGTIHGNSILGNRGAGVKIRSDGAPIVVGNRVHDGLGIGLHVTHTGQGQVRLNAVYNNRACNLHIEAPPSQVVLEANGDASLQGDQQFQSFFSWGASSTIKPCEQHVEDMAVDAIDVTRLCDAPGPVVDSQHGLLSPNI